MSDVSDVSDTSHMSHTSAYVAIGLWQVSIPNRQVQDSSRCRIQLTVGFTINFDHAPMATTISQRIIMIMAQA